MKNSSMLHKLRGCVDQIQRLVSVGHYKSLKPQSAEQLLLQFWSAFADFCDCVFSKGVYQFLKLSLLNESQFFFLGVNLTILLCKSQA